MCDFIGIDLVIESVPDATMLLRFRQDSADTMVESANAPDRQASAAAYAYASVMKTAFIND